jgi:hypothetical protein
MALIVTLRNAVSASISECPRLARGMVTLVAIVAANVKLPRASRGHRRHKPGLLALRKVTIKAHLNSHEFMLGGNRVSRGYRQASAPITRR